MKNKLIVIEGTDCSGKETQTKMLIERLQREQIKINYFSFPNYESPTGKIIGGPYLGKDYICDGWFKEGAANVPADVAILYYAADRKYNLPIIEKYLSEGHLILDRYVISNMAHQAGKIKDSKEKEQMIHKIEYLEYEFLKLPKPDIVVFLYMPYEYQQKLKEGRAEKLDQHELSYENQINSINTYLELSAKYHFIQINCVKDNQIRTQEDINDEIMAKIKIML